MNTLPHFFKTFWYSCTSLAFYKQILRAPVSSSWWFFIKALTLISLVITCILAVPIALFDLDPVLNKAYSTVQESYPDELVITLQQGGYSINQELPYTVPMPEFLQNERAVRRGVSVYDHAVVFTTDAAIGTDVFNLELQRAPIVLTESRLYLLSDKRKQFYLISEILADIKPGDAFVIDEDLVRSFPIDKLTNSPYLSRTFYVPVLGILFFVIFSIVLIVYNGVKALIYALIALLLFKLILHKRALSYQKQLQCLLHILIPVFILRAAITTLPTPFGMLFWLGVCLFVLGLIHKDRIGNSKTDSATVAANTNVKSKSTAVKGSVKPTQKSVRPKPAKKVTATTKKVAPKISVKKAVAKKAVAKVVAKKSAKKVVKTKVIKKPTAKSKKK